MSRRGLWLSLVLLAGCGGHNGAAPPAAFPPPPQLVPLGLPGPAAPAPRAPAPPPAPPAPSPPPSPPGGRGARPAGPAPPPPASRAPQLRPAGSLQFVPAAQSGGTGGVILRNAGARPCRLDGRPAVRFVGGTAPPPQRRHP